MASLPVLEYRPDLSDLNAPYTASVSNVLPQPDGYGPFPGFSAFAAATVPNGCRGYFMGRDSSGSIAVFAGNSTDLYMLSNTTLTWTLVSKSGGPYTALSPTAQWQFTQFNNLIIAVQANIAPQVYDLTSSTAFADLAGSPPDAAYITTVGRFVVLSGLATHPYRIAWSGLNDPTNWTAGTGSSDVQDMADGGVVRQVAGGDVGFIFQDAAIRRMVYVQGDLIFQIDRIHRDMGLLAPYSLVVRSDSMFFLSAVGFQRMDIAGGLTPIGKGAVDKTFLAEWDSSAPHLTLGVSDPGRTIVAWSYKEISKNVSGFTKLLVYDVVLGRWAPVQIGGQFISSLAKPGLTLDGLDIIGAVAVTGAANNGSGLIRLAVASSSGWATGDSKTVSGVGGTTEANGTWIITVVNGTHIDLQGSTFVNAYTSGGIVGGSVDALPFSLDDVQAAVLVALSMVDNSGTLGFLTGDNLEAYVETAEQSAVKQRMFVSGMWPDCDASVIYGSLGVRATQDLMATYKPEQVRNAKGFIPARSDTRYARAKLRIPAGQIWKYVKGIEPVFQLSGGL